MPESLYQLAVEASGEAEKKGKHLDIEDYVEYLDLLLDELELLHSNAKDDLEMQDWEEEEEE